LERTIAALDARVSPPVISPLEDIIGASLAAPRFQMVVLAVFAGSALLLTAIGLFGLLSYNVHRRLREIGLRMALGARPASVFAVVVGRGMVLIGLGCAIGIAAALLLTRFLRELLYGVAATDVTVFLAGIVVLATSGFLACYLPARRAAHIDPIIALRAE
jgi:putative ABC transport system permease protein